MNLTVKGKGIVKRQELLVAIPFIMKKMNAHRLLPKLSLLVHYDSETNYEGYCLPIGKNSYKIAINPRLAKEREAVISTLAHELVHLKQFARRELTYAGSRFRFAGKIWDDVYPDSLLTPWEIEAYGKERGLAYSYFEFAHSR